jgi:hypothetical protein
MEIRTVGPEIFHADGRTDGQTDRHLQFFERAYKRDFSLVHFVDLEEYPQNHSFNILLLRGKILIYL